MVKEHEMASRILSILEEFYYDYITPLINTVIKSNGDGTDLVVARSAVEFLLTAGLVSMHQSAMFKAVGDLVEPVDWTAHLDNLFARLSFDPGEKIWRSGQRPHSEVLYLTDTGRRRAEELLHAHGYRWWEPKE